MNKPVLMIVTALIAGGSSLSAYAQTVCYHWSRFPSERFRLDVLKHSKLSTPVEEEVFGHARQMAFSVHGKEVGACGPRTMLAVTGTVVTASPRPNTIGQIGAHMGLEVHISRGDGKPSWEGGRDFCRSVEIDCTTAQISPTPTVWRCQSRNEWDVYHGASTFTLVDPTVDPLCSFFQDGVAGVPNPVPGDIDQVPEFGDASGLRPFPTNPPALP